MLAANHSKARSFSCIRNARNGNDDHVAPPFSLPSHPTHAVLLFANPAAQFPILGEQISEKDDDRLTRRGKRFVNFNQEVGTEKFE